MNKITQITRKAIFDEMRISGISYMGNGIEEQEFWGRLYPLNDLPSNDIRYVNMAGDLWQHRMMNNDWDEYWFLSDSRINLMCCSDQEFLRFLSETIHPLIRSDKQQVSELLEIYNRNLKEDEYSIQIIKTISGRGIYSGVDIKTGKYSDNRILEISEKTNILESAYLHNQLESLRIQKDVNSEYVIGQCKELIESFCKAVLEKEKGTEDIDSLDFPVLIKEVNTLLKLMPSDVSNEKKGSEIIKKILGSATTITYSINELRSLYGTGHGKRASYSGLNERHASLVLGMTTTLLLFWLETYQLMKR